MRRSPQEKKALSYARDRRNDFGENSKASRRLVPRRKRWANQANRRADQQFLARVRGRADADRAETMEERLRGRRPRRWRKYPDLPLGQVLERRRRQAPA